MNKEKYNMKLNREKLAALMFDQINFYLIYY